MVEDKRNDFLEKLLALQQDGKDAISAPTNWVTSPPLLEVETGNDKIVDRLCNNLLKKNASNKKGCWHFFIGSPGNGKSAATGRLCRFLINDSNCDIRDQDNTPITELDENTVPYNLKVYEGENRYASAYIVQDASAVKNPFASNIDPAKELLEIMKEAWEKGVSLIVCTNRGVLEKAYRDNHVNSNINSTPHFKVVRELVKSDGALKEIKFTQAKSVFESAEVTHSFLDNRSLLLDSDIFSKIISKSTDQTLWNECTECQNRSLCPFKNNRDWLADDNARNNFLKTLTRAEVFSGQIIVFREALALISFILAGCPQDYNGKHPCEWVHKQAQKQNIFSLAMRRIYMCLYGSFTKLGLETDRSLHRKQKKALERLGAKLKESPSTDVGVARLTKEGGMFSEIDAWKGKLSREFLDRWDSDLSVIATYDEFQFSEIEKRCVMKWSEMLDLIEERVSHEAPDFYWALKRWSSNFLLHFGILAEGLSHWGQELDEYTNILRIMQKQREYQSVEELKTINALENDLKTILAVGARGAANENIIPLTDTVTLTGDWVSQALKPRFGSNLNQMNLTIPIHYQGGEKARLGAKAYIWLRRQRDKQLDVRCLPSELLRGIIDARIRAAAKGENAYAFAETDVTLQIGCENGEIYCLHRLKGMAYVETQR